MIKYRMKIREIACDIELENDVIISQIVRNLDKYNKRINNIPYFILNVQKRRSCDK